MHIRKTTTVISLAVIVALSGCDSDNDPTSDTSTITPSLGGNPTDQTSMPAPDDNATAPIVMEGLAGQWSLNCSAQADSAEYSSAQLSVADNVATLTESFFTDSSCTTAASPAVVVTDNSLMFNDTMTTTSLGEAHNVESTVESKTIDGTSATDGINQITYDIMLITNNTLYFGNKGDTNNGTTEALRPQTLDQTMTWSNL